MSGGERTTVLHTKGLRSLIRVEYLDGRVVYGVTEKSGAAEPFVFQGTKAEAKRVYGTWRSDGR